MSDSARRRRRLRPGSPPTAGPGPAQDGSQEWRGPDALTSAVHDPEAERLPAGAAKRSPHPGGRHPHRSPAESAEERDAERGLRGLIGAGASQISAGAALRARDAAQPTDTDLADAEERLVVVRRHWVPH